MCHAGEDQSARNQVFSEKSSRAGISDADIFCSVNAELGAIFIGTTELIEVVREWGGGFMFLEKQEKEKSTKNNDFKKTRQN